MTGVQTCALPILSGHPKYEGRIAELEKELEKYKTNNKRWQKFFGEWQQGKTQLENDKAELAATVEVLEKDNRNLQVQHHVYTQQLQEKEERIIELNRLHVQAQANLEHYRESVREQRLMEQQQFEQQRQELQVEVKLLRDKEIILSEKCVIIESEYQLLQYKCETIEAKHAELNAKLENKELQLAELNLQAEKQSEKIQIALREVEYNFEIINKRWAEIFFRI